MKNYVIFASFFVLKAHIITAAKKHKEDWTQNVSLFHTDDTTDNLNNIFHCESPELPTVTLSEHDQMPLLSLERRSMIPLHALCISSELF